MTSASDVVIQFKSGREGQAATLAAWPGFSAELPSPKARWLSILVAASRS